VPNHNFSLKKKNQTWAAHYTCRNFDKHLFCQGNSVLPFECMICVKYNWRYHFFDYDLQKAKGWSALATSLFLQVAMIDRICQTSHIAHADVISSPDKIVLRRANFKGSVGLLLRHAITTKQVKITTFVYITRSKPQINAMECSIR